MSDRFVARFSPYRLLFLSALSLGFVVLSLWMIGAFGSYPDNGLGWGGWLGLIFFGPCTVILLRRVADRRPQIIADSRGLYWRAWSEEVIPWSELNGITVHHVQRQRLIGLRLRNRAAYPPTTKLGQLARYNAELGFSDVTLSAQGLDRSFDELHRAINHQLLRNH